MKQHKLSFSGKYSNPVFVSYTLQYYMVMLFIIKISILPNNNKTTLDIPIVSANSNLNNMCCADKYIYMQTLSMVQTKCR